MVGIHRMLAGRIPVCERSGDCWVCKMQSKNPRKSEIQCNSCLFQIISRLNGQTGGVSTRPRFDSGDKFFCNQNLVVILSVLYNLVHLWYPVSLILSYPHKECRKQMKYDTRFRSQLHPALTMIHNHGFHRPLISWRPL